jgi:hypothetical protein
VLKENSRHTKNILLNWTNSWTHSKLKKCLKAQTESILIFQFVSQQLCHLLKLMLSWTTWKYNKMRCCGLIQKNVRSNSHTGRNMVHINLILCEYVEMFILWHNYLNIVHWAVLAQKTSHHYAMPHMTMEELLEMVFSMWSVPKLYKENSESWTGKYKRLKLGGGQPYDHPSD